MKRRERRSEEIGEEREGTKPPPEPVPENALVVRVGLGLEVLLNVLVGFDIVGAEVEVEAGEASDEAPSNEGIRSEQAVANKQAFGGVR